MKRPFTSFLFLSLLLCAALPAARGEEARLTFTASPKGYARLSYGDATINFVEYGKAVCLEVNGRMICSRYTDAGKPAGNGAMEMEASVRTPAGSLIRVKDLYTPQEPGVMEVSRILKVVSAAPSDTSLVSYFALEADWAKRAVADNEFFVPGVWYKSNFQPGVSLPRNIPQASDNCFMYRADRITLPVAMMRNPSTGMAVAIAQKDADPQTVMADSRGEHMNEGYRFSSVGLFRAGDMMYLGLAFPGTETDRRGGSGRRAHPVREGLTQRYAVHICVFPAGDYPSALRRSWEYAFGLYYPKIYSVNLRDAYDGLVETLLAYYQPSAEQGGRYDAPGFPFQVSLIDTERDGKRYKAGEPMGINYQMGFVGMQISTGYTLYREGFFRNDGGVKARGEAVLDFWAENCLTELGYPRAWYDPGVDGRKGRFRKMGNIRTATGGMEGLVSGWCFAKKRGVDKPQWIGAAIRFGEWLLKNQNPDGSWSLSYDHTVVTDGRHPVAVENKYGSICAVRYLAELSIAARRADFRDAALKAGEFCLRNIHDKYMYVACVVDNPQVPDSESGQMALNGFLSLWDLTRDRRWLEAAVQAATYTETWTYCYDIPVESDHGGALVVPADRSMAGQHLIALGHAGADLGFAWSSFAYYRLYLETGNLHWLHVARMAAHNTKQTMNWDDSLYPGLPRGLQLEAFRVMIPRRGRGVQTCLNWNYAAHLDPMMRFQDAFGTPDLDEVERMEPSIRKRLNQTYSEVQSSDWGQRRK